MACIEAPIEIVEIILSRLASDAPSLARCSLVDRAWLSLCRQWQFQDVDLTGYRMTSRHARFHKFMDLFERSVPTAPCTLNQYIQGLQIDPTFTPYHISCLNTIDLPNLRSIRIKTSPGTVPAYFLSAVSTTFSEKVHRLDVTSVTFPSQSALLEFLCAFPNLQELVFGENMYAKSTWHPPAASSQLSSNITSLKLSQRLVLMKEEMTAWIVGQIQRGTVQVKRYIIADTLVGGWSSTYPTHLLAAVANTVEELEVDLLFMTNSSFGFLASPNIRFPQLRTLRLNVTLRSVIRITPSLPLVDDWELEAMDSGLRTILSSLDAPALSTLSVSIPHHSLGSPCSMHALRGTRLSRLDDALICTDRRSTPSLQTVEFLLHYCGERPADKERCTMFSDTGSNGARREDTGNEGTSQQAELSPGDTFDQLASQFLQRAVPHTLSQREISLLVSRIAN